MFYCIGKHIEKWLRHRSRNSQREREKNFSNFDVMPAFGLEMSEGELKVEINKTLNERIKTKVRRKTGPARRDDLPWSRDLDSSTGEICQNTSDNKFKQFRLSLAEMSITRISFIQHIHGNSQGKTGPEVGSEI